MGCIKYATFVSDMKPRKNKAKNDKLRQAKKRMRVKRETSQKWDYGFGSEWDQENEEEADSNWDSMTSFDAKLRTTQDELDRLQGELAACQTGLAVPGERA